MLRSIRSAPGVGDDAGRAAHHLGIGAEQLDRDRVLVGMDPEQLLQRALVAVVDRVAGDHLGEAEPGAVALRLQAHEPVPDPGQRREQHPVGDLDVADRERVGERRAASAAWSQLRSWISLSPCSVR